MEDRRDGRGARGEERFVAKRPDRHQRPGLAGAVIAPKPQIGQLAEGVIALLGAAGPTSADVQYVYDSAGRMIRATYTNGVVIEYRYDSAGNRREIITSAAPNSPPTAANDTATVVASQAVNIQVRDNDTDANGDTLTITGVSSPTGGGTATIMGGGTYIRYVAPAATGVKSFTYTISDGNGGTDTATVTVNVTPVPNTPPNAINDTATVVASQTVDARADHPMVWPRVGASLQTCV